MPNRVMFVCAMNVCRSPLLAMTFQEALLPSLRADWSVLSCGTHAAAGAPMCEVAASVVECADDSHLAAPLVAEQVREIDLILTATLTERAILAHVAPGLRPQTFTLREAIMLARLRTQPAWMTEPEAGAGTARRYAALLNARRGLAAPEPPRSRLLRRKEAHPLDIPDVHLLKPRVHLTGLRAAHHDAGEFARYVSAFAVSAWSPSVS